MLADSEQVSYEAWRAALLLHGHDLTAEEFSSSIGTTDRDVAEVWAARLDSDPDVIESDGRQAFLDRVGDVEVFDDAIALRDRLDIPVAVGTNSARWRLEAILDGTGLRERFSVTITASDVRRPKPAPDIYVAAFEAIGIEPEFGLVIEDSPAGIGAARASGARVLAVDRGHLPPEVLADADRLVNSLDETEPRAQMTDDR